MNVPVQAGAKLAANGLDPSATQLPKRPERGEEIELQIDSLAHGGEGVGRLGDGGYVVFVSGALPGDRVKAQIVKRNGMIRHGRENLPIDPLRLWKPAGLVMLNCQLDRLVDGHFVLSLQK